MNIWMDIWLDHERMDGRDSWMHCCQNDDDDDDDGLLDNEGTFGWMGHWAVRWMDRCIHH